MRIRPALLSLLLTAASLLPAAAAGQAGGRTLLAVFAHPDDERIVGPMLARYAREGHRVHLLIATDGSKGVTDHAGIPAGERLAAVRTAEARCSADRLGIEPPTIVGLEDGGLASFTNLGRLRAELTRVMEALRPDALVTIGPEGGTGHPDHRLVGNVATEVVQGVATGTPPALYYASLPTERMQSAPPAQPRYTPVPERYLSVQIPFTAADLAAAKASFDCHESQYTATQRDAIKRMLEHGYQGRVHLRPWNATGERTTELFR